MLSSKALDSIHKTTVRTRELLVYRRLDQLLTSTKAEMFVVPSVRLSVSQQDYGKNYWPDFHEAWWGNGFFSGTGQERTYYILERIWIFRGRYTLFFTFIKLAEMHMALTLDITSKHGGSWAKMAAASSAVLPTVLTELQCQSGLAHSHRGDQGGNRNVGVMHGLYRIMDIVFGIWRSVFCHPGQSFPLMIQDAPTSPNVLADCF